MGKDPDDLSSRNISLGDPFLIDITKLTIGYLDDADMEVVVQTIYTFITLQDFGY